MPYVLIVVETFNSKFTYRYELAKDPLMRVLDPGSDDILTQLSSKIEHTDYKLDVVCA